MSQIKKSGKAKKPMYECIRCGYEAKQKSHMRKHLYDLKKVCPAIKNKIELTDSIKNDIIDNRKYTPLIILIKEFVKPKKTNEEYEQHYIYLLRPKENVSNSQNVYKIGKTVSKELTVNVSRLTSYGKGTELIMIIKCINSCYLEKQILCEFNRIFGKYKFGNEYFVGDYEEMTDIIYECVKAERILNNTKKI